MAQLIGSSSTFSGSADGIGVKTAEAAQFTCTTSGTIDTIQFFNTTADANITSVWLGIFTDGSNLPVTLLGQAQRSGTLPLNTLCSATGLSVHVVSGTVYWLALCPQGSTGQANWNDATTGAGGSLLAGASSTTMTDLSSSPGTWSPVSGFGPFQIYATGTPDGAADLNVNLIN
jgi:hypothetical protein